MLEHLKGNMPDHSPERSSKYAIEVRRVTKVYRSGSIEVDALTDVSFSLERGEFAAIVGPSGSGKSTLMNILGTIDKPTKGEVFIDGVPTSGMDGNKLAEFRNKKLGFIFQAFNLINGLDADGRPGAREREEGEG
jgi:putative ABC transport system ATP-binding protein